ncbi:MAG: RelA/SpoT family protein [Bacillota bacterium]
MELNELINQLKEYMEDADLDLVREAYNYAQNAHEGQYRISGEPFVEHPLGVGLILANLELDIVSVSAALLHDVVEDTEISSDDIEKKFGPEIALLVDGVTKLTRMNFNSKEEHQAESLRKMFLAMAEDIRVVLIKLADRLHNMRTLNYMSREKQIEKAQETQDIYAPLAHRLGMSRLKWELEDLSFRYLQPEVYYEISKKVAANRETREKEIKKAIDILKENFSKENIEAEIYGRPKHLYSIYNKMKRKEIDFSEVYDLTAIRIITDSVRECYEVLGLVHEIWKPIPGRFKDYIAMPKSNMYQSLHTTVIGPNGDPLEVQIRTFEMHRTAEYGIAAHWRYKEGKAHDEDFEEKLSWLRQILEWQKDLQEPHEFMENLKIDLFEDEALVFTPKGDVISLPSGGTPVDFAYNIHTEVGHSCVGAKVNGKIVPLEYELENGDIVEILTSEGTGPSRDWLEFVKTSKAKSKIKRWFKRQRRDEIIDQGKDKLDRALKQKHIALKEKEKNDELKRIADEMGKGSIDSLYESIGYSKISPQQVINKLESVEQEEQKVDIEKIKTKKKKSSTDKGVKVKGMDDILVRLAQCCNPVPGDDIVGYITRGRGVSIHRTDCPNLKGLEDDEDRFIEVNWKSSRAESYQVNLRIDAVNRKALINDITALIKDEEINLLSVHARTNRHNRAHINLSVELSSKEHMRDLMKKINDIEGVLKVSRARPT